VANESTFSEQPVPANAAAAASPSPNASTAQTSSACAEKCSFFRKKRHLATMGLLAAIVVAGLWMTYSGVFSRPKSAQAGTDVGAPGDAAQSPATQPAKGQVTVTKVAPKVLTLGSEQPAKAAPAPGTASTGEARAEKKPPTKLTLGSGDKGGFKSPKPTTRPAQ
jgi:hypothetical protein